MGTSKSYSSPKWPGVNPALSDAVTDYNMLDAIGKFGYAYKSYLKSGTSASYEGRGERPADAVSRRSVGGGRRGGGSGGVARERSASSGARLARFINTAGVAGLDAALQEFNLSYLYDKPLEELLDSVAKHLSGDGGLLDDEALNRAMAETVNELADNIDSVEELEALLTRRDINVEYILQIYYANILAANFEQKEYSIVRERASREETSRFFADARNIIRAKVRDELSRERDLSSVDWNSEDGQRLADEINQEVLDILI